MKTTKKQIRILHAVLAKRGLLDMKQQLVSDATDGRTEHSSEMTITEMDALLAHLTQQKETRLSADTEAIRRMRRRILSMCYTLGWTQYNHVQGRQMVDMQRLEGWMTNYSYLHKPLNAYSYEELPRLISQFENLLKSEIG